MALHISRRKLLIAAGAVAVSASQKIVIAQPVQDVVPRPNPKSFRNGDLVWPKKPGDYVPYAGEATSSYEADKAEWLKQRDAYIKRTEQEPNLDEEARSRIAELKNMEFREFIAVYEGDEQIGVPSPFAGGGLYVGHVGFIEVDSVGIPWVVEAVLKKGVIRQTYADWLAGRPDTYVWHGRIKDVDDRQAGLMISESKKHLGKPYDFWNFDLDSDAGFYCSKLVWLSAHRALDIAVDGRDKARRWFWFSPKQLLHAKRVEILHNPGKYGNV